ncbi:MAG: hypothetical protein Q9216_001406 [Gyalolechia sp. 2 TL-2023]
MSGSTADFTLVTDALGGAFARVAGAVHKLISAETLTAVLCTSIFRAYRVATLDAIARRDLLSPPLRSPVSQGPRIHRVEVPDVLLTDTGCKPDPVLLGLGLGGALDDGFTGGGELTGVEPGLDTVVAGKELWDEVLGPVTEVGGDTAPPAQLATLVAGPGPAWIGLQPGS